MVSNGLNSCLQNQRASEKTLKSCLIPKEDLFKWRSAYSRNLGNFREWNFIVRTFNKSAATDPGSIK
jgi:hypothetical protein